eukprot:3516286-Amphidinium_carterae.2
MLPCLQKQIYSCTITHIAVRKSLDSSGSEVLSLTTTVTFCHNLSESRLCSAPDLWARGSGSNQQTLIFYLQRSIALLSWKPPPLKPIGATPEVGMKSNDLTARDGDSAPRPLLPSQSEMSSGSTAAIPDKPPIGSE